MSNKILKWAVPALTTSLFVFTHDTNDKYVVNIQHNYYISKIIEASSRMCIYMRTNIEVKCQNNDTSISTNNNIGKSIHNITPTITSTSTIPKLSYEEVRLDDERR